VYSPFAKHLWNIWLYFCVFEISASVLEDILSACGMLKKKSVIFICQKAAKLNRRTEISPQQEQRRGSYGLLFSLSPLIDERQSMAKNPIFFSCEPRSKNKTLKTI
jgi:hypothetical protein